MARFTGRSSDILIIKNKPISTGFKIWAIAQEGYILHWIWHQKVKGPVGIKPPNRRLNKTDSVVISCLEILPKQPYCVWLDNLFVSNSLLHYLRQNGYGAAGTARTNSGMAEELVKKKNEEKTRDVYQWGTLFKAISDNEEVMPCWKDNSLCLFQSTVHTGDEVQVVRPRKRPSKISSKAKTARQPFGSSVVKNLPIPRFVDKYNHNMNHVDRADHLRASYETLGDHKLRKGWKALFFWLLNMSLVNAYLLSLHSDPYNTERFTNQKSFRESGFQALFAKSERAKRKRSYHI